MAKESDQTRWVGIRPTDPSEDIPVTLGAEVPHVIVDSGGGGGLMPGAPLIIHFYQANSAVNVWYTIADIAGIGHIEKIHLGCSIAFQNVQSRITIDGGVPVVYAPGATGIVMWKDLIQGTSYYKEMPMFLIRYETGFKIEIRQILFASPNLYGLCSYLPDP